MSIPAQRFFPFLLFDVVPNVRLKRILVDVIHGEMTIPSSKAIKGIVVDN